MPLEQKFCAKNLNNLNNLIRVPHSAKDIRNIFNASGYHLHVKNIVNWAETSGAVFTTLHFLCNLRMGSIS